MISHTLHQPLTVRSLLERAWRFNRLLTLSILLNLALIPVVLAAALLDPVQITGVNGWIKPLKFTISVAIYCSTFLWLLTYVRRGRRWVGAVASVTGLMLILEIGLILMQVIRRTGSHFNTATPIDSAVFSAMGAMITLLALMNLVAAIWLSLQKMEDPVFAAGVRWGVWLSFAGMIIAFLMTTPTAAQLANAQSGAPMTLTGAHSVGVADGGPGLPVLGWSTVAGDLRVAHFVGLHALQVLPILGWWLSRGRSSSGLSAGRRAMLVRLAGLTYLGLLALLTWQALRGQSVVAPDGLTLAVALLLFGSSALLTLLLMRRPRSQLQPGTLTTGAD